MFANYHAHTYRCHHAGGDDRSYVQTAVENGLKIYGVSDHAPYRFPDGSESDYRVDPGEVDGYFQSYDALREEFADKIELHIGFELEYYPLYHEDMMAQIRQTPCEYLILGHHYLNNEADPKIKCAVPQSDPALVKQYVKDVCDGMQTGHYTYLAHPDIFNFTGDPDLYAELLRPICLTARETGTPLEINFLGIRRSRNYPNEAFWKMAGEEHNDVIFGVDAHRPSDFVFADALRQAQTIVNKYSLHLLDTVPFRCFR